MSDKIRRHKKNTDRAKSWVKSKIDTSRLFRMPWTISDNAFSWLEITRRCDLNCDYCYQINDPSSNRPILQIEKELIEILRLRKTDTVLITGGEPLLHPKLEQIVKMVKSYRVKPVLLTNGFKLTEKKVKELKRNGLFGFIIHIDKGQSRLGWNGKSEKELNTLRQRYADMINKEGGMICGFNTTILPETLHEVPDIIEWTVRNIHKVCTNTLIPVRVPREDDPWDLYVKEKKIEFQDTAFSHKKYKNPTHKTVMAWDIYEQVRKVVPQFTGNAFLGGTEVPDAPKWLFGNIIGGEKRVYGHFGPKTMELLQNGYHMVTGRFLSFLNPRLYGMGKLLFIAGIMDDHIRHTLFRFIRNTLRNPIRVFEKLSTQSLLIMQPQDVLPDGRQDLCDGCPNKTYHNGNLVSACRKEEYIQFGDMISLKEKGAIQKQNQGRGEVESLSQLLWMAQADCG
jgi:hypothetical protein